jgi:hypothetical protein
MDPWICALIADSLKAEQDSTLGDVASVTL